MQRNDSGSCTRRAAPGCHSALPSSRATSALRDRRLARRGARRLHARVERRQVGAKAFEGQRRGHVERIERARAIVEHERGMTDRGRVGADQREAVLRRERDRRECRRARAPRRPGARRRDIPRRLRPAAAAQGATAARDRRRRWSRCVGTTGCTPRIEHGDAAPRARRARRPEPPRPCRTRGRTSSRAPTSVANAAGRRRPRAPAPRAADRRRARPRRCGLPVFAPSAEFTP